VRNNIYSNSNDIRMNVSLEQKWKLQGSFVLKIILTISQNGESIVIKSISNSDH